MFLWQHFFRMLLLTFFFHLPHSPAKPLVISKNGASGDYPGCTDLSYTKAIDDLVDVLDCPVQLAKDGTPFCMSSINLIDSTTVAQSSFSNLTRSIPAIKSGSGIFTFSLTWNQIQSLQRKLNLVLIYLFCGVMFFNYAPCSPQRKNSSKPFMLWKWLYFKILSNSFYSYWEINIPPNF